MYHASSKKKGSYVPYVPYVSYPSVAILAQASVFELGSAHGLREKNKKTKKETTKKKRTKTKEKTTKKTRKKKKKTKKEKTKNGWVGGFSLCLGWLGGRARDQRPKTKDHFFASNSQTQTLMEAKP